MNYKFDEMEEEFIRPPDQVIREQLVPQRTQYRNQVYDLENDVNADIMDILEQSMLEYAIAEIEKQRQVEIENTNREQQEYRKKSIEKFVKKLSNLSKFDTIAIEINGLLEPVLDNYIQNDIIESEKKWDENTIKKINDFMKTMRVLPCEQVILNKIFKSNYEV
jgi:polyribonucleotide nucleotidyltransferase